MARELNDEEGYLYESGLSDGEGRLIREKKNVLLALNKKHILSYQSLCRLYLK